MHRRAGQKRQMLRGSRQQGPAPTAPLPEEGLRRQGCAKLPPQRLPLARQAACRRPCGHAPLRSLDRPRHAAGMAPARQSM
eukprot:6657233-Pyramimonas_sp.AAC.1